MKYLIVLLLASLVAIHSIDDLDLPKHAKKKVHQAFDNLWPENEPDLEEVKLLPEIEKELATNLKRCKLYRIKDKDTLYGYLFLTAAPSRYDYFDFMVIYKPDLSIARSDILIYRESYGGEIGSKRWLRQFIGLSAEDDIKLDYDIQGISGATISARSATNAIKRLTLSLNQLQQKGVL